MRKIDTIIKIGGSITERQDIEILSKLVSKLEELYFTHYNFVLIAGGGIFAEQIRELQQQINFSDEIAHWMAILGMDQNGLLLSHFLNYPKIISVESLQKNQNASLTNHIPIIHVNQYMNKQSKLEHTWKATSDAITAEIADFLGLKRILFVKDIDGIMLDNRLLAECSTNEINALAESPIDSLTPKLLSSFRPETYIVNGLFPDRVDRIINNAKTIATKITYEK